MKSFIAFAILSLSASLTTAVPLYGPETTPVAPTVPPSAAPPLPLKSFQLPVTLPNGVIALGAYLQVSVDQTTPNKTNLKTQQIGPDTYFAFEFNSTHAGKTCRFHFSFSVADGSNNFGSEDVYALISGRVDEKITFNNKPVTGDKAVASFLPVDPSTGKRLELGSNSNDDSLLPAVFKSDFSCPTKPTGWEVRGAGTPKSNANWSWNHGLVIEVVDLTKPWDQSVKW